MNSTHMNSAQGALDRAVQGDVMMDVMHISDVYRAVGIASPSQCSLWRGHAVLTAGLSW